jgi:L-amino acid N-acyltransferase YncA
MILRPARPADAEAIARIWNPVIRDSEITFNSVEMAPDDIRTMLHAKSDAGHPFLVCTDGTLLGFATYGQFRGGAGYARTMEHTIVLAPGARGRGIGRRLMAELEAQARAAGVLSLWAGISASNPDGVAFHERVGFGHVARLPEVGWKFGQSYDLILMRKRL